MSILREAHMVTSETGPCFPTPGTSNGIKARLEKGLGKTHKGHSINIWRIHVHFNLRFLYVSNKQ